jgi:hypothetical protein
MNTRITHSQNVEKIHVYKLMNGLAKYGISKQWNFTQLLKNEVLIHTPDQRICKNCC